ncbi:MAG: EamA family transporter [Limimaricola sp.]|uniref:DMT family transporter n=1 Tax=Limimaricola sp. TaxID=2211665 RepID=UPI001DEE6647|nr:DMT family transporter [Limimaricola sp.]MBI1415730.1 EamA family transporter [Limimaricola sp.]
MHSTVNRPGLAAVLVLAAMALFGLIDNFIRLAAAEGGLWQFHMLRSALALLLLVPAALATGARLRPLHTGRVALRSLLNSIAMVIYFGCLGFMPIAQVVAGLFTAPIFVVIFSVVLFRERVGPRRILAVLLGFAGIVLVLRPDAGALTLWSGVPALAGAAYALGNIATRRWCHGEGTFSLLAGFFGAMMIWGALGVAVLALHPLPVAPGGDGFLTRGWVWPAGIYLAMIVVQGVGSVVGVGLSIRAYQMADATFVAVFENTLLVFATLWAIVLWGEVPDALASLGIAMIMLAGIIIALRSADPVPVRAAAVVE